MTIYKQTLVLLTLLVSNMLFAQTKSERVTITKNYDLAKLTKIANEYKDLQSNQKKEAIRLAEINNWPLTFVDDNGAYHELMKVSAEGVPQYNMTFNQNAARSTRAKWLHNGGGMGLNVEGQNMTAYVWDGGHALPTHNEFSSAGGGASRITLGDADTPETSDHGTHVCGTIMAYGVYASTKGMAPQASLISYDWSGDLSEVTNAAAEGMLISNHSYGLDIADVADWRIGAYTMESRRWDNIMHNAPYYLMVAAAGNDGDNNYSNADPLEGNVYFDKLYDHIVSKNTMAVANANDLGVNSSGELTSSPNIESSSSEGPTDDLRVKPDITGNGVNVLSPIDTSNSSYASYTGTSMASPNVAGSLLLLQQLNNETNGSYLLSSTLRGLALHNADDGGIYGPDAVYGWGYLNTKKAAEAILNDGTTTAVKVFDLAEGETHTFQVTSDGINPLLASISWNDLPSNHVNIGTPNRPDPVLVNDLDIRVSKNGTTYEPWKLTGVDSNATGDNNVDVFERVDVIGASGDYTVSVSHKGTLAETQTYSLVITGITDFQNTTGVGEQQFANFKIWPNPNKGIFTLSVEDADDLNIVISDILGKVILSENYHNLNSFTKQFDLSLLPSGVYMVSVQNENKKSTNKIIIE